MGVNAWIRMDGICIGYVTNSIEGLWKGFMRELYQGQPL